MPRPPSSCSADTGLRLVLRPIPCVLMLSKKPLISPKKRQVRQPRLFKIEHAMLPFTPIRPDALDPKSVLDRYRDITRWFMVGGQIASWSIRRGNGGKYGFARRSQWHAEWASRAAGTDQWR